MTRIGAGSAGSCCAGPAEILETGAEHDRAQALLRARYPQYRAMSLAGLPVIALRIERAVSWGDLSAG